MGLTFEQAKALGLGHLHPAVSGRSERDVLRELGIEEPGPLRSMASREPTKLERSFAERLELAFGYRLIWAWAYEPRKFKLAGRCTFTPDFGVNTEGTSGDWDVFVETKGPFAREDSIVKLKVAAVMYPQYVWLFARRYGRHDWDIRRVTDKGIGTNPIRLPWIVGG